jgi:hypothetical protein
VENVPPDENGFTWIARFKYTNNNSTPVFVPAGYNNQLTGPGSFSTSGQPELFMPGIGTWEVRFDGAYMTWIVKSYYNWTLTASSAFARSTSVQCNKTTLAEELPEKPIDTESGISVYPNPASDKVYINVSAGLITADDVFIFDMLGNQCQVRMVKISDNLIEIDLSAVKAGLYLLRIKTAVEIKAFRIIRQ